MSQLPNELLHLIVSYLTNDYREVILFGTVCKDWKEICDTSVVWKTCDLKFRLPFYDERSVTQGFQLAELPHGVRFRRDVSRVVVYDIRLPPNEVKFDQLLKPGFQEDCRRIKIAFIQLLGGYRLLWRKYHIWVKLEQFLKKNYNKFFTFCVISGLISLLFSRCYMSSIFHQTVLAGQHPMTGKTIEPIYFFNGLYSFFAILFVLFVGGVARELAMQNTDRSKSKSIYFDDIRINYNSIRQFAFFLFAILGWLLSIVLLQMKLLNNWYSLTYDAIIRPQYLCNTVGLLLLLRNYSLKELFDRMSEFITVIQAYYAIPASLSILAKVNDSRLSSNIVCFREDGSFSSFISNLLHSQFTLTDAIFPLLPLIFALTFLLLFRIKSTFELYYDYFNGSMITFAVPQFFPFIHNDHLYVIIHSAVGLALITVIYLIVKAFDVIYNLPSTDCSSMSPIQYWLPFSDILLMFLVYLGLLVLQLRIPTLPMTRR